MDLAIEYLWSAGYVLPAAPKPDTKPEPQPVARRGKKAAKAKRARKP